MKKIGLIDSGIGGLTLLKNLMDSRIDAEFLYLSDSHNVPYGGKEQSFMLKQVKSMSDKLIDKGVDIVILACNTLTAETIDTLRAIYSVPFIGIEPYINYLNQVDAKDSKLALILTEATFKSARFQTLLGNKDPNHKIDIYPLKNLAMIIESLTKKNLDEVKDDIIQELVQVKGKGYTHLILGCTHYPIIRNFLENYLSLKVVDPSSAVKTHLISKMNLSLKESCEYEFEYNSDNSDRWVKTNLSQLSFLNDIIKETCL